MPQKYSDWKLQKGMKNPFESDLNSVFNYDGVNSRGMGENL